MIEPLDRVRIADRHDQPSVFSQLLFQWLRDMVCSSGDDNDIKRGILRPPFVAVAILCNNIPIFQDLKSCRRLPCQLRNNFNRINSVNYLGKYGCLVSPEPVPISRAILPFNGPASSVMYATMNG